MTYYSDFTKESKDIKQYETFSNTSRHLWKKNEPR